jgi:hypothetical protein
VDIDRDGGMKTEMKHRVSEGRKVSGVLRNIWKGKVVKRVYREKNEGTIERGRPKQR